MLKWIAPVCRFILSEDGPTAVEYAVMLGLIVVACATVISGIGATVSGSFSKVNGAFGS